MVLFISPFDWPYPILIIIVGSKCIGFSCDILFYPNSYKRDLV